VALSALSDEMTVVAIEGNARKVGKVTYKRPGTWHGPTNSRESLLMTPWQQMDPTLF